MKFRKIIALAVAIIAVSVVSAMSVDNTGKINISEGMSVADIDGNEVSLACSPFMFRGEIYLPVDDVMHACGIGMGWDAATSEIVCHTRGEEFRISLYNSHIKENGKEVYYQQYPVLYNGVACVGEKVIEKVTGYTIEAKNDITTEYKEVLFYGKDVKWDNNGKMSTLSEAPYVYNGELYIPAEDVLSQMGYTLGWQDDIKALVCVKGNNTHYVITEKNNIWVNETQYIFEQPSIIRNDKLFISAPMLEKLDNATVYTNGTFDSYYIRDTLETTVVQDTHRLPGNSVSYSGGVTVVDGVGMEMLGIPQNSAKYYAAVINAVADAVPDVQVYNIAVPTASEFYAPVRMKTDQTSGIRTIYQNLSDKVIPVNVVNVLQDHADEHIYFRTDHHWTQRGAYYAYTEFARVKGVKIPDISEFTNNPGKGFVGSLAGFAGNSTAGNILRNSPETVERFIPKYATTGTVYEDMYMKKMQRTVNAVNTKTPSYMAFIGGDGPVTVFHTTAPSDEVCIIVKESYGNAFATWALHNYKTVYVIDPRKFNGFGNKFFNSFDIKTFCKNVGCDDLIFINYPGAISSGGIRQSIMDMIK